MADARRPAHLGVHVADEGGVDGGIGGVVKVFVPAAQRDGNEWARWEKGSRARDWINEKRKRKAGKRDLQGK